MRTAAHSLKHRNKILWVIVTFLGIFSLACGPLPSLLANTIEQNDQLDEESIQKVALTEEALSEDLLPTQAPVEENVDDIGIHYVYSSSIVTALYHLYGSVLDHIVDITLTNNGQDVLTFLVQTEVVGYTTLASDTVDVPAGESLEIHQNPRLLPEAVDKLNSQKPGSFHIKVTKLEDGQEILLLDDTEEILMYSRRDFVWIEGFDWQEEYELWAAWVTPTDPKVEELIRAAAEYTSTGTMWTGYGGELNDENGKVWDRLQAVWRAEQEQYDLTYISTMTAFGPNTVQRMRLPNEVLEQASGNCIELTTLFVSAAEALGLEAAIIRIPGHAYAAIRMDEENADYYFVETTMIGQNNFEDAVNFAKGEWEDALPHFEADEEGYTWVNLPEQREKGILPIPWK